MKKIKNQKSCGRFDTIQAKIFSLWSFKKKMESSEALPVWKHKIELEILIISNNINIYDNNNNTKQFIKKLKITTLKSNCGFSSFLLEI